MTVQREYHPAIVIAIEDPEKRGRVRVKCGAITGDDDQAYPDWVDPCLDWGWFYVPDIGEEIEVSWVVKDEHQRETAFAAFLENPDPQWRGKRFQSTENEDQEGNPQARRPIDTIFTEKNYGKRRGFGTPNGHVLMFDDTPGEEQVTIAWKGGDSYASATFDKDGSIIILNKSGAMIHMNAKDKQINIIDDNQNVISMDSVGVKIVDHSSNIISTSPDAVQIISAKDLLVKTGGAVSVDAGKIDLGAGAVEKGVLGDALNLYLTTKLSVPTAFGPSGPALLPLTTELSTTVKLK